MRYFEDVYRFHQRFGLPRPLEVVELEESLARFRDAFLEEELIEHQKAREEGDAAKELDALVDLVYVALGYAVMRGFDFDEAWNRVHAANMRKVSGVPSARHATADVVKPPGWTPPDLSDLVKLGAKLKAFESDPIHYENGESGDPGWYFWDETWGERQGPFGSHDLAEKELEQYCFERGL